MDISFCIVNLNAKNLIVNCLNSIQNSILNQSYEILVIDNNSSDGSRELILKRFPDVHLIKKSRNIGYTRAINETIKKSIGNYKVILNPDTILKNKSIYTLIDFLQKNKKVSIVGPKVINEDKSFQKSCRRGIATPIAVFSYFFGLAKLFPLNKKFNGYHLNYLDKNKIHAVKGVSGSCMVIKNELFRHIGYFDEQFFAYQEDSDFCLRALKKGHQVYYNPDSIVTHIGGRGGANSLPLRANFEWHRSYVRYYFKHLSSDYSRLFNLFYLFIMILKLIFSELRLLIHR